VEVASADTLVVTPRSVPQLSMSHMVASKEAVAPAQDGWTVSQVPARTTTAVAASTVLPTSEERGADALLAVFKKIQATSAACLALTAKMAQQRKAAFAAEASSNGTFAARASALAVVAAALISSVEESP
jgi:hypothetical protein